MSNFNPDSIIVMKTKRIKNNLTEITTASNNKILVSYETPVAAHIEGVYYRTAKKWSKTTTRHLSYWFGGVEAEEKDQSFFDDLLAVQA